MSNGESKKTELTANELLEKLKASGSFSEIEAVMRNAFSASQSEATAIVAAVKKVHSDCVTKKPSDNTEMLAELTAIFNKHTI